MRAFAPQADYQGYDERNWCRLVLECVRTQELTIAIDESAEPAHVDDEGDSRENVEQAGSSSQQPSAPDPSSAGANETAPARPSAPRGGTKLAEVVELLQRDRGATIDELIDATGWLPHTTRAALTALRKRGFALAIDRTDKERGSIYRIEKDSAAENSAAAHFEVAQADSSLARRRSIAA